MGGKVPNPKVSGLISTFSMCTTTVWLQHMLTRQSSSYCILLQAITSVIATQALLVCAVLGQAAQP